MVSDEYPNVFLSGGPLDFKDSERLRLVKDVDDKVKLLRGNGYEHFEPTDKTVVQEGISLRVFEWSGRTYIAE